VFAIQKNFSFTNKIVLSFSIRSDGNRPSSHNPVAGAEARNEDERATRHMRPQNFPDLFQDCKPSRHNRHVP